MSEFEKEMIRLAFSIYSSPGSYALLLGSGVSKSAGIKTGWEIMIDLINKIACLDQQSPEDPLEWYRETFEGEEPSYDNLLDRIAHKSIDRRNILSEYFDPSPEDQKEGKKIPQDAHKAIAKLVKQGYIKIILTTNFDRLLESALLSEGVHPYLIYSDDGIDGCLPPAHIRDSCIIYKIHGDFKDTRLRNTPEELKTYPEKVNNFLNRILEDFGVIVCGWSAEWDIALREAIGKKKENRFGIYWTTLSSPGQTLKNINNNIEPIFITISGADKFFQIMYENIEALRNYEYPVDPLTIPIAIERTKKYLSEKNSVRLFDLLSKERMSIYTEISSDRYEINNSTLKARGIEVNDQLYIQRFSQYEELIKPLCRVCGTIAFFDDGEYGKLISSTVENLAYHHPCYSCFTELQNLENYPLYLLFNVVGVIALANNHFNELASFMLLPRFIDQSIHGNLTKKNILELLRIDNVLDFSRKYSFDPKSPDKEIIVGEHVYNFIFDQVGDYIPNKQKFIEEMQKFKFLCAMVYTDVTPSDTDLLGIDSYSREISALEMLKGKPRSRGKSYDIDIESTLKFFNAGRILGNDWGLIKAGFFNGKIERLLECYKKVKNHDGFSGNSS